MGNKHQLKITLYSLENLHTYILLIWIKKDKFFSTSIPGIPIIPSFFLLEFQ